MVILNLIDVEEMVSDQGILFGCSFYFPQRGECVGGLHPPVPGIRSTWAVGMSIFATFVSSISFRAA